MPNRKLFAEQPDEAAVELQRLCDLEPGQTGECFVVLGDKQRGETRDGKPYYRCQFRDQQRTATAMIWNDSSWFPVCDETWQPGDFFRVQARFQTTQYGPQIDLLQIRPVVPADAGSGFDPAALLPKSKFDPDQMFADLLALVGQLQEPPLRELVEQILQEHREAICEYPAASRNHHAYRCGFVEHVLSVTQTARFLAEKYQTYYPSLAPPLSKDLVIAGAVLHDIGKLRELAAHPSGADYTAPGRLIGHILLGRDLVREYAPRFPTLSPETLLRLEHIIVSHQNLPEWGSPIAPHTPEALLVHYADDIDAKFQMMAFALGEKLPDDAEFTSRSNPLRRSIFRGLNSAE